MDERPLSIHEVKLMIQSCPGLHDSGSVGQAAHGALHSCKVSTRHNSWRLVVDPNLEPCWTPVNELDTFLGLDRSNGGIDIFGDNITAVEQTAGHVLA